jgi:hypothetical protein
MNQILIYRSEDGRTKLDVRLEDRNIWLNQKQLAELFAKAKGTISEHIKHIFEDEELTHEATVRLFRTVQKEGDREVVREVEFYNLDMVLALGFRVRSPVAVRFRQWAADKLKEYIVKGFVLDDERLKNPKAGNDYFEELTRRIQDIRTSERRFYQKITDIYATSVNYDKDHPLTQEFFATGWTMTWSCCGSSHIEVIPLYKNHPDDQPLEGVNFPISLTVSNDKVMLVKCKNVQFIK